MKIKLVIADDHHLFIDGIRSILDQEFDINIIGEAANGLELIKMLDSGVKPDIILSDIRMPVMDGITATRIITKNYPDIPVLALTMFDQHADVSEMLDAGVRGYVTKEVKKDELIKAIHAVVMGNRYFTDAVDIDLTEWEKNRNTNKKVELTRREREILKLIVKGRTTLEIASELKLSKFTIDTHRKNIHKKLNIKSNAGLVSYAMKNL